MTFAESTMPHIVNAGGKCKFLNADQLGGLKKISPCIVFLHALWSVPSVKALKAYSAVFARFHSARPLDFYIVNFDDVAHEFLEMLPGPCGGNGETFFVRDGKVVENISQFDESFFARLQSTFIEDT